MGLGSGRSLQLKLWQSLQRERSAAHETSAFGTCVFKCVLMCYLTRRRGANTAHTHTKCARREVMCTAPGRGPGAPRARGAGGGRGPRAPGLPF